MLFQLKIPPPPHKNDPLVCTKSETRGEYSYTEKIFEILLSVKNVPLFDQNLKHGKPLIGYSTPGSAWICDLGKTLIISFHEKCVIGNNELARRLRRARDPEYDVNWDRL